MKIYLCVNRLLFSIWLFISMVGIIGCGGDDGDDAETYEEKLAGTYTLSSVELDSDGVTVTLKPPNVSGRFVLNAGGSWSAAWAIPDEGIDVSDSGNSWSATASLIIYDDGTRESYSLTGNTLEITVEVDGVKVVATFKK